MTRHLPVLRVRFVDSGADAVINATDFDPARHAPVDGGVPPDEEARAKFVVEQLGKPAVEVIEKVQEAPADALDVLGAMRAAEAAGKARKTVLEAIDAQLAKLTAAK